MSDLLNRKLVSELKSGEDIYFAKFNKKREFKHFLLLIIFELCLYIL